MQAKAPQREKPGGRGESPRVNETMLLFTYPQVVTQNGKLFYKSTARQSNQTHKSHIICTAIIL